MRVTINGEQQTLEQGTDIASLLVQLGVQGKRIAVELNEEIIPASAHAHTLLAENDCLEIVHAIGGG